MPSGGKDISIRKFEFVTKFSIMLKKIESIFEMACQT